MLVSYSVFPTRTIRFQLLALALCWVGVDCTAHALERVYLDTTTSSPFECTHHESLESGRTRLYIYTPGSPTSADNFTEISSKRIVSIEIVPDPAPTKPTDVAPKPLTPSSLAVTTDVRELLAQAGAQHDIDVDLLASIVKAESGGHSNAVSRAGARGLMQLMPETAHELGVDDAFRPDQNIAGGTTYLDYLLKRYDAKGDKAGLDKALAAYNAGPAAVDRYHGIPPYRETKAYVARVENEFVRRKKLVERASAMTTSLLAGQVAR